jgi:hypothetical protein
LIGKPEGQRPVGDNIKVDVTAVGCEDIIGIEMPQDKVKWPAMLA